MHDFILFDMNQCFLTCMSHRNVERSGMKNNQFLMLIDFENASERVIHKIDWLPNKVRAYMNGIKIQKWGKYGWRREDEYKCIEQIIPNHLESLSKF